ncbi:MAG: hypothetical protein KAU31_10435 [Spirochaetaceae bacterium]|nr:hypothetical protein [Spirochaetaceae bacterium]
MLFGIAPLESKELEAIQNLERRLGKRVLALKQMKIEFDDLTEGDLAEIQQLEVELGLAIIAVR